MSTQLLIIIAVVVLIIVIGAANRKALVLWIRSESNSALKDMLNSIKVLKLRVSDYENAIKTMINNAGDLKAEELTTEKRIKRLNEKIAEVLEEASKAKSDGKMELAKAKLLIKVAYHKELNALTDNLEKLVSARTKLEVNISKMKANIAKLKVDVKSLEARKSTNDVLKKAQATIAGINGTNLEDSIEQVDEEISTEEFKLEYISEDETDDSFSEEIEKEFEELK